ncbi:hypothetical protein GEMRC1_010951 [Eukaryota sp. GEM-RC1]
MKMNDRVKQGDSLDPFLFCLPLQRILRKFSSEFQGLRLNSYADDTSLVGPLEVSKLSFPRFVELSSSIGLSINFQKCLVIGRSSVDLNCGESSIPFVSYSDECFKFLGNYIGNDDKIKETLSHKNNCIFQQLNQIVDLDVGKQVSFAMLQVCFGSKINHFLRGLPPELTLESSRNFN